MSRDVEVPVAVNDVAAQRVSGLDSTECRYDLHGECRDSEAVHCLCACHKRPEIWRHR